MKHYSILIFCILTLLINFSIAFGDSGFKTISLPQSYEGSASLKVTGTYHASIPENGSDGAWHDYQETMAQSGEVHALLVGNYLIYMPAIDKPLVTGTLDYSHHSYWESKPLTADIAPAQNITLQNSQGVIGLYINYTNQTYTISLGLSAEGDSTNFDSSGENVTSRTKKRFELEKVELILPLPHDLQVLKGSKIMSGKAKTADSFHKVLRNEKTIEIAWEFIASTEKVVLPKEIPGQTSQGSK